MSRGTNGRMGHGGERELGGDAGEVKQRLHASNSAINRNSNKNAGLLLVDYLQPATLQHGNLFTKRFLDSAICRRSCSLQLHFIFLNECNNPYFASPSKLERQ